MSQQLIKMPFGSTFTDHMFVMEWKSTHGWHNHRIQSYQSFTLDPASSHMHYGQEIFEGMKAYKAINGTSVLFRPHDHLKRMNNSARIMCMPEIDCNEVLIWLKHLLQRDEPFIPTQRGSSLYIRPTMIATQKTLQLLPATEYLFFIILSPVGSFYEQGFNPVPIFISQQHTRASRGGVGQAKAAGNYGASMRALQEARAHDCSQVLWLDPEERRYIEEVGAMNIFFVINTTLITPTLTDSILAGITRSSIIDLARKEGIAVEERRIALQEVIDSINDGSMQEIFGTGTAAVVTPVGSLHDKTARYVVNASTTGPITQKLFTMLTDIQYGKSTDEFGWLEKIE